MTTLFELAARLQSANAAEELLWMVVKATLILAIARLLLLAMPRASAAMKHVVATAALAGVAAMPVATFVLPAWQVRVASSESRESSREAVPPTGNKKAATVGVTDNEAVATAISVAKATGLPDRPITAFQRAINVAKSTWKGMILVAIGSVTLLMLVHMVIGMIGVWFVTRDAEELNTDAALVELDAAQDHLALDREVRLLYSQRVAVPIVWGFFRPVLLLPADAATWPAERLRVVLLHELAHLKRWDGISVILTRIAVSLFWFHPLAWSLERAGRSECERACDDLVLASGTKPSVYADHLLAIARAMPVFDPFRSVTLAMSRKTQLEGRLLSILQPGVARRVFTGRRVAIACALAVAVLIPVSAMRLVAGPSEEKDKKPVIREEKMKTDAEVDVEPEIEAIGDFFLAKLGKYDKRADKWIREPRNAEERYERAYDLYRNDRYDEAAVAFRLAGDEGYRPETAYYNAACSYALIGDVERSLAELDRAIDAGWDDFDHIADDSDFDPIRGDRRFSAMLESKLSDIATRRSSDAMEKLHDLKNDKYADPEDWFDAGHDLLRLRKLDESIEAFEKSIASGEKISAATYNIACAYSLKGDVRNGMLWLDRAAEQGFSDKGKFENDPDIALLREQPGFDAIAKKAKDLELRGCCDGVAQYFFDGWDDAVRHHRAMTQKYPTSGRAWFNLGYTSLQARDYATSQDAFRKALDLNYREGTSAYNMACAYALQGNRDEAFEWLRRSEAAGFDVAEHARDDDDLDSLHRDSRWKF